MTLQDRVDAFKQAFPDNPDSWPYVSPSGRWLYGTWEVGQNTCATSPILGSYPPTYVERVHALFPDVPQRRRPATVLHAFSGALPSGPYLRLDVNPARRPDVVGNVYDAPRLMRGRRFRLVLADPPYNERYAKAYNTPTVDRLRAMAALAGVTTGFLIWLDARSPMFSKQQWAAFGKIPLYTGTNRICRTAFFFQRRTA